MVLGSHDGECNGDRESQHGGMLYKYPNCSTALNARPEGGEKVASGAL
jgi:hypothetical protein